MNTDKAKAAVFEAKRFIKAAEDYLIADSKRSKEGWRFNNPKEQGACRRASMDLTRSLAELRKAF